jgi:protein TonB
VEAPKIVDPKAVEAEVKRLAAERERALKEGASKRQGGKAPEATAGPAAISLVPRQPLEPPKPLEASKTAEKPAPPPPEKVGEKPAEPAKSAPETVSVADAAAKKGQEPVPTEVAAAEPPPVVPPPSNAPVSEGDLVGEGEGVVGPKLVQLGSFGALPPQARQIGRASDQSIGTTFLMALISPQGAVEEVRIIKPSNYKFVDDAAVRALKNARIEPARKDGVRVRMWKTFRITVKP